MGCIDMYIYNVPSGVLYITLVVRTTLYMYTVHVHVTALDLHTE